VSSYVWIGSDAEGIDFTSRAHVTREVSVRGWVASSKTPSDLSGRYITSKDGKHVISVSLPLLNLAVLAHLSGDQALSSTLSSEDPWAALQAALGAHDRVAAKVLVFSGWLRGNDKGHAARAFPEANAWLELPRTLGLEDKNRHGELETTASSVFSMLTSSLVRKNVGTLLYVHNAFLVLEVDEVLNGLDRVNEVLSALLASEAPSARALVESGKRVSF
jgi:hypothetical protein